MCKKKKKIYVNLHFPDEKDLDVTLVTCSLLTQFLGHIRKLFPLVRDTEGFGRE